jgi:hypothetical protein
VTKGSAFDRIMADPKLAVVRRKLSADDIYTIIRHVWAADTETEGDTEIIINGDKVPWTKPTISHEEICELANQPTYASVAYSYKVRQGTLSGVTFKDKVVSVYPGMKFDCVVTGNA